MVNEETIAFARMHRGEDTRELALHAKPAPGVDITAALEQIAGWNTARIKLPEWAACDGIWYPPHLSMEQCSSEATARHKADVARRLAETEAGGATSLVDLTGGLGVDCSYLARCFDKATYVERQPHLCELARHNMAALGLDQVEVVEADAVDHLRTMEPVSLIYLDPARRDAHGARTYAVSDCTPDALALLPTLLDKAPHVMVKLSPMLDWHRAVDDFGGHVAEVHIVSTGNECKELLLVLDRERHDALRVVCAQDGGIVEFRYDVARACVVEGPEKSSLPRLEEDDWRFLYEPNASVMKAGCFDLLEARYEARQVAPNSHVFVSSEPIEGFPGRAFAIERIATMNKRDLKEALRDLTHANITSRNFPLSVAQLRKKLRLKDGGDVYLFATTDGEGRHIILRTHKVR